MNEGPRYAVEYSDGSMNIFAPGTTVERAQSEYLEDGSHRDDPKNRPKLVKVVSMQTAEFELAEFEPNGPWAAYAAGDMPTPRVGDPPRDPVVEPQCDDVIVVSFQRNHTWTVLGRANNAVFFQDSISGIARLVSLENWRKDCAMLRRETQPKPEREP